MDIKQIKVFVLLAEKRSFNKVAKELNMTTSNLIRKFNTFEEEMNAKLFIRSKNGLDLTDSGNILLSKAYELIYVFEAFLNSFESNAELRIGLGQYFAPTFYDTKFSSAMKDSGFTVVFKTGTNHRDLFQQLIHNDIDVFYYKKISDSPPNIRFLEFGKENYYVVSKKGVFSKESISLKELADMEVFLTENEIDAEEIARALTQNGKIEQKIKYAEPHSLVMLTIENDKGVLVTRESFVGHFNEKYDTKLLNDVSITHGFYYRYLNSPLANMFEILQS